jgi:arylsulfatase A-like enzyme
MGRKILFITTDQQRFDALGCNGGRYARTPVADRLAAEGLNYQRGHAQNVVCMPSRSTMVSGQYVQTHGVWMNGVPLPENAPSIAAYLKEKADYHTALLGKAHFQPALDPAGTYAEGRLARENSTGPYRGFDHVEFVMHGPVGFGHYPKFMRDEHPDDVRNFYRQVLFDANGQMQPNHAGGGDTDACQVHHNPSAREIYHTDWVADRTIAYLNALPDDADFFVWMSFPDPHHPWDPPASEIARIDWRDLDLPDGYPGSADKCREVLSRKPHHWLDWFERGGHLNIEAPLGFIPAAMQADQIREINAMTHIENELIDEACGRVIDRIAERGWQDQTDIFFTSDHGEFQGDFGLVFKGPYHVDSLMRVPFIWRPAPSTGIAPAEISEPVGHVDLAATFCEIAGIESPDWNEGRALPKASGSDRSSVVTEWDHEYQGHSVSLRTIYKDRWLCTRYLASSMYEGNEGELYDLVNDPNQFENLWDVAEHRAQRDVLLEELSETLSCEPDVENRRPCVAPV